MDAPKCRQCGKKLRPHKDRRDRVVETPNLVGTIDHKTLTDDVIVPGRYDLDDLFCTVRCGYEYGVRAARRERGT